MKFTAEQIQQFCAHPRDDNRIHDPKFMHNKGRCAIVPGIQLLSFAFQGREIESFTTSFAKAIYENDAVTVENNSQDICIYSDGQQKPYISIQLGVTTAPNLSITSGFDRPDYPDLVDLSLSDDLESFGKLFTDNTEYLLSIAGLSTALRDMQSAYGVKELPVYHTIFIRKLGFPTDLSDMVYLAIPRRAGKRAYSVDFEAHSGSSVVFDGSIQATLIPENTLIRTAKKYQKE